MWPKGISDIRGWRKTMKLKEKSGCSFTKSQQSRTMMILRKMIKEGKMTDVGMAKIDKMTLTEDEIATLSGNKECLRHNYAIEHVSAVDPETYSLDCPASCCLHIL
jgi:hypothetical protein